jgi:hypothetical protein
MTLRKSLLLLCIVSLLALPVLADGKPTTVKGEILDLACYVSHDAHGDEHAKCAERCVKGGQPMGLLAEDGTVYVLFADHSDDAAYKKAQSYAGKVIEISGPMAEKAGMKGITVHAVKEL